MPLPSVLSRRAALKLAGAAAVAIPALRLGELHAASPAPAKKPGWRLGVAGYSVRDLTVDASIAVLKQLEIVPFTLFRAHVRIEEGTVEECREGAKKLRDGGLELYSTGVVNFSNDEAKARKAFENARAAGLPMMTCKPAKDCYPLLDRLVKEYDLRLAIHNHGPEDALYPAPEDAWKLIEPFDSRIGLCIDVGHTMRAKGDAIAAIKKYRARLLDVHLKDSQAVPGADKDIPIEAGHGRIDLRGICAALTEIDYRGVAAYEYERIATNPVMGLAESIGYVRGVVAAL